MVIMKRQYNFSMPTTIAERIPST